MNAFELTRLGRMLLRICGVAYIIHVGRDMD